MMAVNRWDPFRDLISIQNELGRLFDRAYGGVAEGSADWVPSVDVYEVADRFVIEVELPGLSPEEVDISVEDQALSVEGERRFTADLADDAYRRIERRYGRFARSLQVPPSIDAERIEASFDAGVLSIQLPKRDEAQPKRISVRAKA
jgi:HSP20 family protein